MRTKLIAGIAIAACAGVAQAQGASQWGYFEADGQPLQAGVVSPDGGQLILKCDDTGEGSVFAVIVSPQRLRPSTTRPQVRALWLQFDGGNREEVRWRYYETSVTALNTRRDQTLEPFLRDMVEADQLTVRFDPADSQPFSINFTVTGAREAIDRVFESCEDESIID
ncbi:hypothetical protein OZN62_06935 [Aurantiacibacter sp. MUD11]|uniref:hypothetical protein n=1 Tax=Aurantiacibacter sp. MUD11 TaxID=3003265 RepID=UPI0022AACE43|nr:hypothetical protein [Aurantiacibacter sp. MUD11]WAT16684.1 hypothetical protein OZN62_06935 [Aurantiacibacter sp. MUD11]